MEKKAKNISISVVKLPRVPNLAVSLCWKCPHSNWYTLDKVKGGRKTKDPQFKEGGNCVVLCYSMFQRLEQKVGNAKSSIDCMSCEVHDSDFQICFSTENKLSKLKKTLKLVVKNLDPSKAWKQYSVNMRNFGGRADKSEFNHVAAALNNSLKSGINIMACGSVKMVSTKAGKKISESDNLGTLATYVANAFPKLSDSGSKSAPKNVSHSIPDYKDHTILKISNNSIGIEPALVSMYVCKTLSIRADPDTSNGRTVIVWHKSPESKLKSIKKPDRIKRELLVKRNINEDLVFNLLRNNLADCCTVRKFYNKNPSPSAIASAVSAAL